MAKQINISEPQNIDSNQYAMLREDEDERGMKMKWEWRWDERYITRTRRGERKRRGKEQTHTNTPSPERANPEKAREKEKSGADGHGPRPAEGGEDGSAWTNLTQRKPTKTSARDGTNLPGEGRENEIGDQWGTSCWKKQKNWKQDSVPKYLEVVRYAPPGSCSGRAAMA